MSSPPVSTQGPSAILEKLVAHIDDVSSLPQVAMRVMEIANDPKSTAAELKSVMENDVSLSARVLRCINSAAYALRVRVTNIQQAIAYLGMKQIRNIAMTASVSDLFRGTETIGPYRRGGLWRHLVAVGLCARLIAMRRKLDSFEDAFLAGLLHDIGLVLADQYAHLPFSQVIGKLEPTRTLCDVERSVMGFDHTMLGEKIGERWGFPEAVQAAIRHHHASVNYRGDHIAIVRCVEVANIICTLKEISSVGLKVVRNSPPALAGLSLTGADLKVLAEDLDREMTQNAVLFSL
ncbi:MAG: HDOD domain-containing protein [Thermoguttaceae bacterium]|jgi:HD-like signal output (HDOD) protein